MMLVSWNLDLFSSTNLNSMCIKLLHASSIYMFQPQPQPQTVVFLKEKHHIAIGSLNHLHPLKLKWQKHKAFRPGFAITQYKISQCLVKHLHIAYLDMYVLSALLVIVTWLILNTRPKSTIQNGSFSHWECVQLWWFHIGSLLPSTALDDTLW